MGSDQHKATVVAFFDHLARRDLPGAIALTSESCTWWYPLSWPTESAVPGPGDGQRWPREHLGELLGTLFGAFVEGPEVQILQLTAEDDRVAVEVAAQGITRAGVYDNRYHFLFEFTGGRISAIREYTDTDHVRRVVLDLM
jgi:ketosteroid isomerase-like protein